jgi:hypothetical protein
VRRERVLSPFPRWADSHLYIAIVLVSWQCELAEWQISNRPIWQAAPALSGITCESHLLRRRVSFCAQSGDMRFAGERSKLFYKQLFRSDFYVNRLSVRAQN